MSIAMSPTATDGPRMVHQRDGAAIIGGMDVGDFRQMKAWIGLTPSEADQLRQVGPRLQASFPGVVELFYRTLLKDPQAKAVFRDDAQIHRVQELLNIWMQELFEGRYDEAYFEKRSKIGRTHVRVDLPQRFVFTAMSLIRTELTQLIQALDLPDTLRTTEALHKLLDLELAIMLETYRESLVDKVREADRIIMQRQLDEVQHMATIGQLAASLAHEIKNPLAGISGAVQVLSAEMEDSHPHRRIMKEILQQIDRLDSAVEDLLIYARPKPPDLRQTDVGQVIRNCLNVLRGDPSLQTLTVKCEGADHHLDATIDSVQMEQVVSNLVLNAAQACNNDGQITIALAATDDQLMIRVQDNGEGMSEETRKRALEPFFTTKAKGTGLGLSICGHIVQAHQGSLQITSTPGVGTLVEICLPRRPHATGETRRVT